MFKYDHYLFSTVTAVGTKLFLYLFVLHLGTRNLVPEGRSWKNTAQGVRIESSCINQGGAALNYQQQCNAAIFWT